MFETDVDISHLGAEVSRAELSLGDLNIVINIKSSTINIVLSISATEFTIVSICNILLTY